MTFRAIPPNPTYPDQNPLTYHYILTNPVPKSHSHLSSQIPSCFLTSPPICPAPDLPITDLFPSYSWIPPELATLKTRLNHGEPSISLYYTYLFLPSVLVFSFICNLFIYLYDIQCPSVRHYPSPRGSKQSRNGTAIPSELRGLVRWR